MWLPTSCPQSYQANTNISTVSGSENLKVVWVLLKFYGGSSSRRGRNASPVHTSLSQNGSSQKPLWRSSLVLVQHGHGLRQVWGKRSVWSLVGVKHRQEEAGHPTALGSGLLPALAQFQSR